MLTQTIHVMLSDPGLVKKIEVVQGDTGREIECIVDDMQIPEGATAIICGVKPSMKGFRNSCTVSGQKITAEITNQMDAEEGWTPFQILIQDAGSTVSTFTIVLDVKKSYSGDFPVSENESTWLEEYVEGITEQVNTATENAEAATLNANTATKNANSAADAANAAAEAVEEAVSGVINDNQVSESTTYSSQKLGNFSQLLTTAKNTFVAAINELVLKIGDLKQLATTEKTDIVSAINEIEGDKLDKENIANNLTTTQEGYALDARQGRALDDKVTQLNSALAFKYIGNFTPTIFGETSGNMLFDKSAGHYYKFTNIIFGYVIAYNSVTAFTSGSGYICIGNLPLFDDRSPQRMLVSEAFLDSNAINLGVGAGGFYSDENCQKDGRQYIRCIGSTFPQSNPGSINIQLAFMYISK